MNSHAIRVAARTCPVFRCRLTWASRADAGVWATKKINTATSDRFRLRILRGPAQLTAATTAAVGGSWPPHSPRVAASGCVARAHAASRAVISSRKVSSSISTTASAKRKQGRDRRDYGHTRDRDRTRHPRQSHRMWTRAKQATSSRSISSSAWRGTGLSSSAATTADLDSIVFCASFLEPRSALGTRRSPVAQNLLDT